MGVLIKARLRSAEWRIVMERLDSVNVFIFPMLKFKKWNSFWAPGCTLSCLKRSYYLLRVCPRRSWGIWTPINHKKIIKAWFIKTTVFFFFLLLLWQWKNHSDSCDRRVSISAILRLETQHNKCKRKKQCHIWGNFVRSFYLYKHLNTTAVLHSI